MPELRTARENARLEIGSQRGRNSHQIGVLGIYDLQGLSYGRTELLVADMRLLAVTRCPLAVPPVAPCDLPRLQPNCSPSTALFPSAPPTPLGMRSEPQKGAQLLLPKFAFHCAV